MGIKIKTVGVIGKINGLPIAFVEEDLAVVAVEAFPDHPALGVDLGGIVIARGLGNIAGLPKARVQEDIKFIRGEVSSTPDRFTQVVNLGIKIIRGVCGDDSGGPPQPLSR